MKKLTYAFMACVLAASTLFSSCHKDDDGDEESDLSVLKATVVDGEFSTSLAAFYSSKSSENTGTTKLGEIFSSTDGSTTIAGTANGMQLAITIKGTTAGTYKLSLNGKEAVTNTLINLLSGKSVTESIKDAVDVQTDAMIIYRKSGEVEGGSNYWFSTEATVTFDNTFVLYATGTFSANMTNKAGDTFTLSNGSYKVFGKPVTNTTNQK